MDLHCVLKTVTFNDNTPLAFVGVCHVVALASTQAYIEIKFLHDHFRKHGLSENTTYYDWARRSLARAAEGLPAGFAHMGRREQGLHDQHVADSFAFLLISINHAHRENANRKLSRPKAS